jgi:hypothetical protein
MRRGGLFLTASVASALGLLALQNCGWGDLDSLGAGKDAGKPQPDAHADARADTGTSVDSGQGADDATTEDTGTEDAGSVCGLALDAALVPTGCTDCSTDGGFLECTCQEGGVPSSVDPCSCAPCPCPNAPFLSVVNGQLTCSYNAALDASYLESCAGGSYRFSCTNYSLEGGILSASCKNAVNVPTPASLDTCTCPSQPPTNINNQNGVLSCN